MPCIPPKHCSSCKRQPPQAALHLPEQFVAISHMGRTGAALSCTPRKAARRSAQSPKILTAALQRLDGLVAALVDSLTALRILWCCLPPTHRSEPMWGVANLGWVVRFLQRLVQTAATPHL